MAKKQADKSKRPRGRPVEHPMPDSIPDEADAGNMGWNIPAWCHWRAH